MKKGFIRSVATLLAVVMMLALCAAAADVDYNAKIDEALDIYKSFGLFSNDDTDYLREAIVEMMEEDPNLFYEIMERIYSRDDRYSHYLSSEGYEENYQSENTMVGIGVVIAATDDGYLTVQGVSEGPAKKAGIQVGDKLVEADGMNIEGYLPEEAVNFIKGKEGTSVRIKVLRGEELLTFNVKRATIATSDVTSAYIDDKIGYIKLSHFNGITSFIDFMKVYDEFEEKGINTVILDLRNNPGGQLDCLINLMDNIIPKADVPYLTTWQAKPLKVTTYTTEGYGWEFNKFVILVNGQTASASEIMAGAMQDLGYAVVVGDTTYGKGRGQVHMETSTGDEAVVTALELKLPVSGGYDAIGIEPDYKVSLRLEQYKLPYLTPLKSKMDASKIKTENVRALEERLRELGYFYSTPDDVWDKRTVHAVNLFCRDNNLTQITSICKWELIQKIDDAAHKLEYKYVPNDTQLEKAIEIAKTYSESDKKAECVDQSVIDFKRG
ncbi:MAG: PDZ domain-containing protein [Oscillospiraceae bacterium]|nr:PDZ domain-containing protein [Oscillospiraceae bacterium]